MNLGRIIRVEKGGAESVYKCPKCGRPKFYVNDKKGLAHCFRCTYAKRLPRLIKKVLGWVSPERIEPKPLVLIPGFEICFTSRILFYLRERRVRATSALGWGWGSSKDFPGRIIIPVTENHEIKTYVARSVDGQTPKEKSGPNRSEYFYGKDQSAEGFTPGEGLILVEGIFDWARLESFGYNCLALMGSHISDVQVGKLISMNPSRVVLMMDGDEAGRNATKEIFRKLGERMNPYRITQIYLPDGVDPDDLSLEEVKRLF